jgi:hypothetical protein
LVTVTLMVGVPRWRTLQTLDEEIDEPWQVLNLWLMMILRL